MSAVLRQIVAQYVVLMQANPLLALESLFRFSEAAKVTQMLNNYFVAGTNPAAQANGAPMSAAHVRPELLEEKHYNFDVDSDGEQPK